MDVGEIGEPLPQLFDEVRELRDGVLHADLVERVPWAEADRGLRLTDGSHDGRHDLE